MTGNDNPPGSGSPNRSSAAIQFFRLSGVVSPTYMWHSLYTTSPATIRGRSMEHKETSRIRDLSVRPCLMMRSSVALSRVERCRRWLHEGLWGNQLGGHLPRKESAVANRSTTWRERPSAPWRSPPRALLSPELPGKRSSRMPDRRSGRNEGVRYCRWSPSCRLCRATQSARASASATVPIASTSTASYSPKIKVDVMGSKPSGFPLRRALAARRS